MNFPPDFIKCISDNEGFDELSFSRVHELPAPVSVRINPFKPTDQFKNEEQVLWCRGAFYLKERPEFIFDPLLHAGCYYVQEAGSMFLDYALRSVLKEKQDLKVLDLCAAPGGKSTLISSYLNGKGLLVSNEVIRPRAQVLAENLIKWNPLNVLVSNNDPSAFKKLNGFFDVMVCDVPCSGSGLFRKDAKAMEEWSENGVDLCASRQKRILADVLPALKSGGYLFYSTCSYSRQENEDVADWLIDNFEMESVSIDLNFESGIVVSHSIEHKAFGYRFYPDKVKAEGFFMAVFRKKSEESELRISSKQNFEKISAAEKSLLDARVKQDEETVVVKINKRFHLLPGRYLPEVFFLIQNLHMLSTGLELGELMKDELIPSHALAQSNRLTPDIDCIDLNLDEAIQYLRRDEIKVSAPEKGWKVVKYKGFGLGWIKHLGNRCNNYYPKEWRILKQYKTK